MLQVFQARCTLLLLVEYWENERIWSPDFMQSLSAPDELYQLYANLVDFLRSDSAEALRSRRVFTKIFSELGDSDPVILTEKFLADPPILCLVYQCHARVDHPHNYLFVDSEILSWYNADDPLSSGSLAAYEVMRARIVRALGQYAASKAHEHPSTPRKLDVPWITESDCGNWTQYQIYGGIVTLYRPGQVGADPQAIAMLQTSRSDFHILTTEMLQHCKREGAINYLTHYPELLRTAPPPSSHCIIKGLKREYNIYRSCQNRLPPMHVTEQYLYLKKQEKLKLEKEQGSKPRDDCVSEAISDADRGQLVQDSVSVAEIQQEEGSGLETSTREVEEDTTSRSQITSTVGTPSTTTASFSSPYQAPNRFIPFFWAWHIFIETIKVFGYIIFHLFSLR
ncbi:hypothetical protein BDP27DRAFT_1312223 [Rhodocollybia butyracea]|uniref:Uncharacterized protein n=1 Tax=Rhodocollybia butyracea TaxID=206335 RepID=A0A9P5QAG4_9AGAR|nr:hypothetical protein BDP27DRAFT_1312223 [Rhodocollybia butyracea]